jgi:integrase
MAFLLDAEELQTGLIIFRRADVKHKRFYCRVRIPGADRYKVVSLKTDDPKAARTAAFKYEIGLQTLIDHNHPVFNRPFSQIADEYAKGQRERTEIGDISNDRADNVESRIRTLNLYVGTTQISNVGQADWNRYPIWRQRLGKRIKPKKADQRKGDDTPDSSPIPAEEAKPQRVSNWTIRAEMSVFRAVMTYAASKSYISESQIPKGKLHAADERREEFTREEYSALHSKCRAWMRKATRDANKWYREMTYLFMMVMCNTGMRPPEAKNLRWRDVTATTIRKDTKGKENKNEEIQLGLNAGDAGKGRGTKGKKDSEAKGAKDGTKADEPEQRKIVILNVRGKGKFRRLVAPSSVGDYFERIRAIAKAKAPDDYVFTTHKGEQTKTLYASLVKDMLDKTGFLKGPEGTDRSTYSFRHTYATMRLSEGVDVYLLAEQMGTSVQIIEDHYGHINPVKNADRILLGMHLWETPEAEEASEAADEGTAGNDRVNKGAAVTRTAKASKRKPRK